MRIDIQDSSDNYIPAICRQPQQVMQVTLHNQIFNRASPFRTLLMNTRGCLVDRHIDLFLGLRHVYCQASCFRIYIAETRGNQFHLVSFYFIRAIIMPHTIPDYQVAVTPRERPFSRLYIPPRGG